MISTGMRQISCIKMPLDAQSLGQVINHEKYQLQIKDSNGTVQQIEMQSFSAHSSSRSSLSKRQSANSIVNTSKDLQKTLKRRYQYQGGLIEEVIYNILYTQSKADRGTYRF